MSREFVLTSDHLRLLRRMCVGWQDCETGAPEIDPKRPYGNSSVAEDVREILQWQPCGSQRCSEGRMCGGCEERALTLHRETGDALQIVLSIGRFDTGAYERRGYSSGWQYVGALP